MPSQITLTISIQTCAPNQMPFTDQIPEIAPKFHLMLVIGWEMRLGGCVRNGDTLRKHFHIKVRIFIIALFLHCIVQDMFTYKKNWGVNICIIWSNSNSDYDTDTQDWKWLKETKGLDLWFWSQEKDEYNTQEINYLDNVLRQYEHKLTGIRQRCILSHPACLKIYCIL